MCKALFDSYAYTLYYAAYLNRSKHLWISPEWAYNDYTAYNRVRAWSRGES